MNIIFDIETEPRPKALEEALKDAPQFDPAEVKTGNIKDPTLIESKIEQAKNKHIEKSIEWMQQQRKKCSLDPDLGQISAIGILHIEDGKYEILDATENEAEALAKFWHIIDGLRPRGEWAFGWNIEGFDLPFLFGRSRLLGVSYDHTLITNYRYFHKCFVDLHKVWTFGAYGKYCSLKKASKALGFLCEDIGITGATFSENWRLGGEQREKARLYLKQDLDQTMAIATATYGLEQATNPQIKDDESLFA